METEPTIYTEQIDDTPLLHGLLQKMGLQPIIDGVLEPHGHRQGLSFGWIINIWLIHILREKNHCMDVVQGCIVTPQHRIFIWKDDVREAISDLNLVPAGVLAG